MPPARSTAGRSTIGAWPRALAPSSSTTSARPTRTWPPSGSRRVRRGRRPSPPSGSRPARWPVQALRPRLLGQRTTDAPTGCARSSAAPPPTACLRSTGRSRSPATRWPPCGRPPTRRRSAERVSFSLAAFRQAFAAGRDLSEPDNVLLAAAAARCTRAPCSRRSSVIRSRRKLREATERAGDKGVRGVPAIVVGERGLLGRRPPGGGRPALVVSAGGKRAHRRRAESPA